MLRGFLTMKCILVILLFSCAHRPLELRVIYTKNGYTYASSSYRTYRAKLDTVLKRGTIITVTPTKDTCPYVFKRIN